MPDLARFYHGKRVLVTGHTGFKGSWLTQWLLSLGAKVSGYALVPETSPAMFDVLALDSSIEHSISDIRNFDALLAFVKRTNPEIIFHLAAQPLVRRAYREPRLTYDTNIMGTVNLLEATRLAGIAGVVIVVTSDKVYADKEWVWGYRETDSLGGRDPYSASKACAELVSRSYYEAFFEADSSILLSTVRAGNVIGGGDWSEDRILPDCITALSTGKEILVRNPLSIRPWQHVMEPLYGYLVLAASMWNEGRSMCDCWNFGPDMDDQCTVAELVEFVVSEWGSGSWRASALRQSGAETSVLKLSSERAHSLLRWRPQMNHRKAIRQTVAWYSAYYSGSDAKAFTSKQIDDYSRTIREESE